MLPMNRTAILKRCPAFPIITTGQTRSLSWRGSPGPVSYTHLDVYKRQPVGWGLALGAAAFLAISVIGTLVVNYATESAYKGIGVTI